MLTFIHIDSNKPPAIDKHSREALDNDLSKSIESASDISKQELTWNDVAGLDNAKQELQIAVEMPLKQPQLFTGKLKRCQSILLYGPPGTGKTHLARVLAATTESKMYILSTSDLTNMWVGNSARLVRLMFEKARTNRRAIIFFDEIDAICGQRERSSTNSSIEQKSELLAQMDGAKTDNKNVLFIGATNLPWSIDSAFLRRFEKKLYIGMPNFAARERMLMIEFGKEVPVGYPQAKKEFLSSLEGFSGSDVKRLVQETVQEPLREIEAATHFVQVSLLRAPLRCPSSRKAIRTHSRSLEAAMNRRKAHSRWDGETSQTNRWSSD